MNTTAEKIVNTMRQYPLINLLLVLCYACFIVFIHPHVVDISVAVMNNLSLPAYNTWVKTFSIATVFLAGVALLYQVYSNRKHTVVKLIYLFITFLLLVVHSAVLFEMNIEIIHGLMYSLLTLLLFPLTGRYGTAVIYALPVMFFDEWYQYQILYPDYVSYYELNDIVMDILGSGFAVTALFILNIKPFRNKANILKRMEWLLPVMIVIIATIGIYTCWLALYPHTACEHTVFVFNKLSNPDLFWQVHPFTGATYHVLSFSEAAIIIVTLCYFYALPDIYLRACLK